MVYGFDDNLNKVEVKDKATQEAKDQDQDGKISALETGKADAGHNHDDKYYTESEMDTKLNAKLNHTGNQTFTGELRVTRNDANVPLFVRAPNEENAWIGVTNKTGTGYFGVDADRKPMFMGYETEQIALMSDVPEENNLLKRTGGTMNGEIRFNGGSTQGGSKIVLENGTGQITNSTTGTLFGFLNSTDVACGEATYNLLMRGKATRPTYNGNDMALKSDVPDVSNYATKTDLNSKAGTSVATTSANGLMSSTDKSKLDGVESGANKTVVDSALSSTSTNPLQNKVVNQAIYNQSVSLGNQISAKQDKLTAGSGITINNNVISANVPNITISSAEPSGGSHGDIWFKYSESSSGGDPLPGGGGGL